MKSVKYIIALFAVFIIAGCGKKSNPSPAPGKAILLLPAQDAACTTGVVLSATQSTITFSWNAAANTNSYELHIKNLLTAATTSQTITITQAAIALSRNTPYSWYLISKSTGSKTTTTSDTWKFYNAGEGTLYYAPYPAELTSPSSGQNVTATAGAINLNWKGTSADNDIKGYDVYFGTRLTPPLLMAGVTDMFLNGVNVASGTNYYWKVITNDAQGNSSDSGLVQFKVN